MCGAIILLLGQGELGVGLVVGHPDFLIRFRGCRSVDEFPLPFPSI